MRQKRRSAPRMPDRVFNRTPVRRGGARARQSDMRTVCQRGMSVRPGQPAGRQRPPAWSVERSRIARTASSPASPASSRPSSSIAGSSSIPLERSRRRDGVQPPIVAGIAGGLKAVVERHAGGGRRLGERLGVLEVEAAAECEPAGGEREARSGAELDRADGCAQSTRRVSAGKRSGQTSGSRSASACACARSRTDLKSQLRVQRGRRHRDPVGTPDRPLDPLGRQV